MLSIVKSIFSCLVAYDIICHIKKLTIKCCEWFNQCMRDIKRIHLELHKEKKKEYKIKQLVKQTPQRQYSPFSAWSGKDDNKLQSGG